MLTLQPLRSRGQLPQRPRPRPRRLELGLALLAARESRVVRRARALVVGGTGRVGGSTAAWLRRLAGLDVAVAGRSREAYEALAERWRDGDVPDFVEMNHKEPDTIRAALSQNWDLVLHTAGPFQGIRDPSILKVALEKKIPYVDVCDDTELCQVAKGLEASVPAVVSAGIWPGVSALMVCEAHARLGDIQDLEMCFYTAGTGGAGPTIVSATFLLLAEPPLNYEDGQAIRKEVWSRRRWVDFGVGVGKQPVHLLDEPEVYTCHKYLDIPNVSSSFGTAPDVWNWMFAACRALPSSVLKNRGLMQQVSQFSMPIITAVDALVGSRNAMRVEATNRRGERCVLRVIHEDLEDCVGLATAAFGLEVLEGHVPPGVWFPVEMAANRSRIFERVKRNTVLWDF